MKILVLKPMPREHVYSRFADSLVPALSAIGHDASAADLSAFAENNLVSASHVAAALSEAKPDAAVSFGSFFGGVAAGNGQSMFDLLGVKFAGWQLDHPIYVHNGLRRPMQGRRSIFSNRNHQRFAEAIGVGGQALVMLPGGQPPETSPCSYAEREWPVFLAATWNGLPERTWETLGDTPARRLFASVVERLMSDTEASVIDALRGAAKDQGLALRLGADPDFDNSIVELLRGPLSYVRHHDRIEIVKSLVEAGLPLTLCGAGWRDFLGERGNLTFIDRGVNFRDMPDLYRRAKVSVNINAGNGGCERAIFSMMAGAAVVSDYSSALAGAFAPDREIAFFDRARPASVVETVSRLLESDRGEAMAAAGAERAQETATWEKRAEALAAFLA